MTRALRRIRHHQGLGLATIGWFVAPVMLLLANATCVTDGTSDRSAPSNASDAARHAVHGDKLVQVMGRIERYRRQSWPQEVESEYASDRAAGTERAFKQATELAAQLSEAAKQIAEVVHGVDMAEADRRGFLAQVGVFESQVHHLQTVTAQRDAEGMRRALHQIDTTCRSCHRRFRDVSGPMD